MIKMDLRLKINIKIYYYTKINVIKYYFEGLYIFRFPPPAPGSWKATPRQTNGSAYSEFYVSHSYLLHEIALCNVRRFDQAPNVLVALYISTIGEGCVSNFDQVPGYSDIRVVFRTWSMQAETDSFLLFRNLLIIL